MHKFILTFAASILLLVNAAQAAPSNLQHSTKAAHAQWQTITVKPGDNLAKIFSRVGLKQQQLQQILTLPHAKIHLANMHPNCKLHIDVDEHHQLQKLDYPINKTSTLSIQRVGKSYREQLTQLNTSVTAAKKKPLAEEKEVKVALANAVQNDIPAKSKPTTVPYKQATGTIHSSLHLAIKRLGLPNSTSQQLVSAFKEQIDLASNLHPGDQFQLLYQPTASKPGKPAAIQILAARFTTHNKTYEVVRYDDSEGHTAYYKPDGKNMKSGFLRIPVENAHVSSGFTFSRIDPIFNIARPHLGVDFAAPMGSPIKATSEGKVIFLGQKNGYGNTIIIKRDERYSTLYAHLRDFADGLHTGSPVHQGQIIAHVGCNGHATGPHLHYEFWVDGARRDPLTVELPKDSAIPKIYLAKFTTRAHYLLAQLDSTQHAQLAANTGKKSSKSRG